MPAAVDAERLLQLVTEIFRVCTMNAQDAHLLADTLVDADLSGVHSHGVLRVPEYVEKLTAKGVNPQGRPRVVSGRGACQVVDGDNSMGQIGMHFAMKSAIAAAHEHGVGIVAIRGSNHSGAMAYYARLAVEADMIGWATTNALPTMAPWGGVERLLGINPLGLGVPADAEPPILYDAAFSGSSHGKIRIHQQKGEPLPEGWALDSQGQPTTDPALALEGLLQPIGAFKGAGLAMMMGILSSMLSGAAYGTELGDMEAGPTAGSDGHFVMAIDVSAFEDVTRFKTRVDAAIRQVRDCRRGQGMPQPQAPGGIEHERRVRYRAEGIPLNAVTLRDLAVTAQRLQVEVPTAWVTH
ncbi:MAG: Ldh family oxidoreductase [Gemmatimonadetes bacterium]|nr:Ldh family oxidoreductase [Gemmatimonadota bacterium]MBT4612628.1 Ldh family oxidoreductase [Gemmatimonadota bacterium]MBT5055450.1 Ldh family oxidoreductase [Gemmatimonadota bacterium]MBT5143430.1 Ldh family oxidoreductase [Gemmatimonadota bacterium]MBT5587757.1 Ldh family oxidoreductase [Gemmatimonadota bacterium]